MREGVRGMDKVRKSVIGTELHIIAGRPGADEQPV